VHGADKVRARHGDRQLTAALSLLFNGFDPELQGQILAPRVSEAGPHILVAGTKSLDVERNGVSTSHFGAMLAHRMIGGPGGDDFMAGSLSMDPLMHFTPGAFLGSPGLWIGLAVAAVFLAAAVRRRRYRDPI